MVLDLNSAFKILLFDTEECIVISLYGVLNYMNVLNCLQYFNYFRPKQHRSTKKEFVLVHFFRWCLKKCFGTLFSRSLLKNCLLCTHSLWMIVWAVWLCLKMLFTVFNFAQIFSRQIIIESKNSLGWKGPLTVI